MTALVHDPLANSAACGAALLPCICDDLPHQLACCYGLLTTGPDLHLDYGVFLLARVLTDHVRTLVNYGLPAN